MVSHARAVLVRGATLTAVAGALLALPQIGAAQVDVTDGLAAYSAAREAVLAAPHRSRLEVAATTRVGGVTTRQNYTATTAAASATRFMSGGFAKARLAGDAVRVVGAGSRYYAIAKDGTAYFGPPKALLRLALAPDGAMRLPDGTRIESLRTVAPVAAGTVRLVGPLTTAGARSLVNILLAEDASSPLAGRSVISGANVEVTLDAANGRLLGTRVSADVTVPAKELKGLPNIWITGKLTNLRYTLRASTTITPSSTPIVVTVPPKAISAVALAHDRNTQTLLRKAARAFEVHYLGAKSFSTVTPARLKAIDATVVVQAGGNGRELNRRVGFTLVNGGYGYELRSTSRTGKVFIYRRDALAQVFTSCRTPAGRSCGAW